MSRLVQGVVEGVEAAQGLVANYHKLKEGIHEIVEDVEWAADKVEDVFGGSASTPMDVSTDVGSSRKRSVSDVRVSEEKLVSNAHRKRSKSRPRDVAHGDNVSKTLASKTRFLNNVELAKVKLRMNKRRSIVRNKKTLPTYGVSKGGKSYIMNHKGRIIYLPFSRLGYRFRYPRSFRIYGKKKKKRY